MVMMTGVFVFATSSSIFKHTSLNLPAAIVLMLPNIAIGTWLWQSATHSLLVTLVRAFVFHGCLGLHARFSHKAGESISRRRSRHVPRYEITESQDDHIH